tara:strand:+ start:21868 stop:23805 length:1938 start_codon:yes stop_codon:yes gene_type:complete
MALTANLSDVDTRHIRAIAPVQDNSTAAAITAAGEVAAFGIKTISTMDLVSQTKDLQQGYLDEQQEQLSTQEQVETDDFRGKITRLQNASKQTGRTSDFKIRAEALLKERINAFPGLASHYRQAMSGVLGFDPTGQEAKQLEASLEANAKTAQGQLDALDKDYVNNFGGIPGAIVTPAGQQSYLAAKEVQQMNSRLEARAQTIKLSKELGASVFANTSIEEAQKSADAEAILVGTTVNTYISKHVPGITDKELQFGMTPETYTKAPPEVWEQLIRELQTKKAAYVAKQSALYMELNPQLVDNVKIMSATPYDNMIESLSGKQSLESNEQARAAEVAVALNNTKDTKAYQNIAILSKLGGKPGVPIFDRWMTDILAGVVATPSVTDPTKVEVPLDEIANITKKETTNYANYFVEVGKYLEKEAPENIDKKEALYTVFNKLAVGMSEGNAEGVISKDAAGAWLDVLANKDNIDFVNKVNESNPDLTQSMNGFMFDYMRNLEGSAKGQIKNLLDKYTFTASKSIKQGTRTVGSETSRIPFLIPEVDERGALTFRIDKAAIKKHNPSLLETQPSTLLGDFLPMKPTGKLTPFMKDMERLKKTLAVDLRKVVSATANMSGGTEKEAADLIVQDLVSLGETTTTTTKTPRR